MINISTAQEAYPGSSCSTLLGFMTADGASQSCCLLLCGSQLCLSAGHCLSVALATLLSLLQLMLSVLHCLSQPLLMGLLVRPSGKSHRDAAGR